MVYWQWFKQRAYWLKGGIIGLLIYLLSIILIAIDIGNCSGDLCGIQWVYLTFPWIICSEYLFGLPFEITIIIYCILNILLLFGIGSMVGGLLKKLNLKNKQSNNYLPSHPKKKGIQCLLKKIN